jgi:hypothetical protein
LHHKAILAQVVRPVILFFESGGFGVTGPRTKCKYRRKDARSWTSDPRHRCSDDRRGPQ